MDIHSTRINADLLFKPILPHQEELLSYYKDVSGQVDLQRMSTTVSLLSSYNEQELSVTLSRIRKKIKNAIGTEFAKKYLIDPLPNGLHGILISRERVRIADDDPSNGLENF